MYKKGEEAVWEESIHMIPKKNLLKKLLTGVLTGTLSVSLALLPIAQAEVLAADTYDELTYYEWTVVGNINTTYKTPAKNTIIRSMLCFSNQGVRYISGHGDFSQHDNWTSAIAMSDDRQVNDGEDYWLTDNGRGAPFFVVGHEGDSDNSNEPYVLISAGETTAQTAANGMVSYKENRTSWDVSFDDNDLEWKGWGANVGSYKLTIKGNGWHDNARGFNVFHNEWGRDPVLRTQSWKLDAHYQTDEDARSKFWAYTGKEVKFIRYPSGIWVNGGQVTALTKNSVLPEGTVTTVNKGAVMSINSTSFLNGKIVVDGGTLVIQEGATLMTYSRDTPKSGSGSIEVKNGGSLVVMNNARVALGRTDPSSTAYSNVGQLKLTDGGKMYNFGFVMVNRLIMNSDAEIENRRGAELHAGYQLTDKGAARFYFKKDYKAANMLVTNTGTGGSLISADEGSVKSVSDENIKITNKGTITFSSVYSTDCMMSSLIEGNKASFTIASGSRGTDGTANESSF